MHTFDVFGRNNLTVAVRMVCLGTYFRTWLWRYLLNYEISSAIRIRRFLILAVFIEPCVRYKLRVVAKLFFVIIVAAAGIAVDVWIIWFLLNILRNIIIRKSLFFLFFINNICFLVLSFRWFSFLLFVCLSSREPCWWRVVVLTLRTIDYLFSLLTHDSN